MSLFRDVKRKAQQLPARLEALDKEFKAIAKRLQKLEKMGLERGKAHWRKEREKVYLYLIYPMDKGARTRVYVGSDPKKVKQAQDAIARAYEFDELAERQTLLQQCFARGTAAIDEAARYLDKW